MGSKAQKRQNFAWGNRGFVPKNRFLKEKGVSAFIKQDKYRAEIMRNPLSSGNMAVSLLAKLKRHVTGLHGQD